MNHLSKKALRGMIAGALACTTTGMTVQAATLLPYSYAPAPGFTFQNDFTEVHDCAGKNICKGLGGCKITQESLNKLAAKMGVPADKAGSAHSCAGLNACKGLGGCAVTAETYAKLSAKANAGYSEIHSCAGLNVCKGLGGCAVTAEKLSELAAKVGVPADKAGSAHGCAGQNSCKGLGGCAVTAETLAKLKAKAGK